MIIDWKKVLRDEGVNRAGITNQLLARQLGIALDSKVIGYKDSTGTMSWYVPEGGEASYNSLAITGLANSGTLVVDVDGNVSVSSSGSINPLIGNWNYTALAGPTNFVMDYSAKTISIHKQSTGGDYNKTLQLLFELSALTVQDTSNSNNFKIIDITGEGTLVGDIWTFDYKLLREEGINFTNEKCTLIFDIVAATGGGLESGPCSNRPTSPELYQEYFDTDYGFKVIYNGLDWVNAAGGTAPCVI